MIVFIICILMKNVNMHTCVCSDSAKSSPAKGTPKKMKVELFKLTKEQKGFIKEDEPNRKLWDDAMNSLSLGPVMITLKVLWMYEACRETGS